jgi:hypothetical protein
VLKREADRYFLVTPVEKCGIVVDDAPFLAVELTVDTGPGVQTLHFRTNVDDWVTCGPDNALRFEPETGTQGLKPYVHAPCSMIWSNWAKSATSAAFACSASRLAARFFRWRRRMLCKTSHDRSGLHMIYRDFT